MVRADFCAIVALHNTRFGVLLRKSEECHQSKVFNHFVSQMTLDELGAVQNVIGAALSYVKNNENPDEEALNVILEKISLALNALNVRFNERVLATKN